MRYKPADSIRIEKHLKNYLVKLFMDLISLYLKKKLNENENLLSDSSVKAKVNTEILQVSCLIESKSFIG